MDIYPFFSGSESSIEQGGHFVYKLRKFKHPIFSKLKKKSASTQKSYLK